MHLGIKKEQKRWINQTRTRLRPPSPYRSLLRPLLAYIDAVHLRHPQETLTVVLPEFVVAHWWEYLLHNQMALRLKAALLFRPGVAVLNLPQHFLRDKQRR